LKGTIFFSAGSNSDHRSKKATIFYLAEIWSPYMQPIHLATSTLNKPKQPILNGSWTKGIAYSLSTLLISYRHCKRMRIIDRSTQFMNSYALNIVTTMWEKRLLPQYHSTDAACRRAISC
jgi:hypothetical protein